MFLITVFVTTYWSVFWGLVRDGGRNVTLSGLDLFELQRYVRSLCSGHVHDLIMNFYIHALKVLQW